MLNSFATLDPNLTMVAEAIDFATIPVPGEVRSLRFLNAQN